MSKLFETGSLSKQYSAALYYLQKKQPAGLLDYHDELIGLQLQINHGEWLPIKDVFIKDCNNFQKIKRRKIWKSFDNMNKLIAMKKMLGLVKILIPGWHTQLEIIDKFDEDYEKLRNYTKSEKKSTGLLNERTVYKSKHVRRLSMPNNGETERLLKTARSSRNKDNDSLKRPHSQQGFSDTPIVEYKDSSKLKQLFKEIDTKSQTLEEYPHETLIKNGIKRSQTDKINEFIKPKLKIITQMITKIQEEYEYIDLTEIHKTYMETLSLIFKSGNKISKKEVENDSKLKICSKTSHFLKLAINAIKEINDPWNHKRNLFGVIKLHKEEYEHQLNKAKEMLNLEDTQVIIDIESLINYYKDEIYYLKEELKLKDTEIDETKKLMINKVYFQEEKRPKNLKNDVKNVITN